MTTFIFANNINTELAGGISPGSTTLTLSSTLNLPTSIPSGSVLVLTLNDQATKTNFEIVYVTAISGATLTVSRAQEGTSAKTWLTGDFAFSGPTAGQMQSFVQGSSGVSPGSYGSSTQVATFTVGSNGLLTAAANVAIAFPITSFNGRGGAVTLSAGDINTALGFTPLGAAISANTLLGNPTGSSATPQAITLASGLQFSSTTLGLANIAGTTLLGNSSVSSNPPSAVTLANGLQFSGSALGLGAITPSSVTASGAVSGATGIFNSGLTAGATTLSGTLTISAQQAQVVLNSTGTSGNSWAIVSAYSGSIAPAGDLFFYNSSTSLIALQLQNNGLATFTGSNTNGQGFIIQDTASGASSFAGIGFKSTNGTTTPNKWIRASGSSGNLEFINSGYASVIAQLSDTGAFTAATGNFTSSDRFLKMNIVPVEPKPLHRNPEALTIYDWRDGRGAGRGPIAQAVQSIEPAYVHVYDEEGHLAVETGRAAYEQGIWCGREIDALLARVASLEARI